MLNFRCSNRRLVVLAVATVIAISFPRDAGAYIEIPYSLGKLLSESTNVMIMQVEKVDKQKNLIIYKKIKDLKGTHPTEQIKHNIGQGGFHPREWQAVMAWAEPGKMAIFFHNGGASETCINGYWYQAYAGGEWWSLSHGEPYLLRTFAGKPEKLAAALPTVLSGQEIILPCMVDTDKNSLQLGTAKVQRLKQSLKLQDYNPTRDFVGWGGEDFRAVQGMPGFERMASVSRVDPQARGVAVSPGDGKSNLLVCYFGDGKVSVIQVSGASLNEINLPHAGGARAACWADYNGDGRADLLLATPAGPKLFTNLGETFRDDSAGLPQAGYAHLTAAAWIATSGKGQPDILLADGFRGLRLYRNLGPQASAKIVDPVIGPWYYCGPFDNAGGTAGFDKKYPPEQGPIDLKASYPGKGGKPVNWKEGKFPDGTVNSLAILEGGDNENCCVYLVREFNFPAAAEIPISLGSDDGLAVWFNGEKMVSENTQRGCAPDQNLAVLKVKPGKNVLLLKVTQGTGDFAFYYAAKGPTVRSVPPLFADVSDEVGLGSPGVAGRLKGDHLIVGDVNEDGRPDVLFGGGEGMLLLNTPKGFVEAPQSGIRYQTAGVTPVFGDFNGDKHLDLFIPQDGVCQLLAGDGQGHFRDATATTGELNQPLGRATSAAFVDYRGAGAQDLVIGCLKGPNRYFRNESGKFVDASDDLGLFSRIFNTRGVQVVDVNRDGGLDLAFCNEGQESSLILAKPKEAAPAAAAEKPAETKAAAEKK